MYSSGGRIEFRMSSELEKPRSASRTFFGSLFWFLALLVPVDTWLEKISIWFGEFRG